MRKYIIVVDPSPYKSSLSTIPNVIKIHNMELNTGSPELGFWPNERGTGFHWNAFCPFVWKGEIFRQIFVWRVYTDVVDQMLGGSTSTIL
jgi:hypothetical protein